MSDDADGGVTCSTDVWALGILIMYAVVAAMSVVAWVRLAVCEGIKSAQATFLLFLSISYVLRTTESACFYLGLVNEWTNTLITSLLLSDVWAYLFFWLAKVHFLSVWVEELLRLGVRSSWASNWAYTKLTAGVIALLTGIAFTVFRLVSRSEAEETQNIVLAALYLSASVGFAAVGTMLRRRRLDGVAQLQLVITASEAARVNHRAWQYVIVAVIMWLTLLVRAVRLMIAAEWPSLLYTGCSSVWVTVFMAVAVEIVPPAVAVALFPTVILKGKQLLLVEDSSSGGSGVGGVNNIQHTNNNHHHHSNRSSSAKYSNHSALSPPKSVVHHV